MVSFAYCAQPQAQLPAVVDKCSRELAVKIKYLCIKSKTHFDHSHFRTKTAPKIQLHEHYVFTKTFIFSYNNAQINRNATVQYLKSITFVQKT